MKPFSVLTLRIWLSSLNWNYNPL